MKNYVINTPVSFLIFEEVGVLREELSFKKQDHENYGVNTFYPSLIFFLPRS